MRDRLKSVRQVPGRVVTSGFPAAAENVWMGMGVSVSALGGLGAPGNAVGGGNTARTGFAVVHGVGDAAMSEPVQAAMRRARESLEKDESGPGGGMGPALTEADVRRVNRKRRCVPCRHMLLYVR